MIISTLHEHCDGPLLNRSFAHAMRPSAGEAAADFLHELTELMDAYKAQTRKTSKYDATKPSCAHCYKQGPGLTLLKCSKCKKRVYCSRDCQRLDWKCGTPLC